MTLLEPPIPRLADARSGARAVVLDDVFVNWRVPPPDLERDLMKRRRKGQPLEIPAETIGRVVDVSAGGMGVVAEAAHDLDEGARVRVRLGRSSATVRIVHFWDLPDEGWRLYGTEVVDADERFRDHLRWWREQEEVEASRRHVPVAGIDWVTDDVIWYFVDEFGERLAPEELIARRAEGVRPTPGDAGEDG